jgi:multidrug transporter EmrE-like cation transporter
MNITVWALILAGVLLNATAQLLLKAGTNSIGAIGLQQALSWGMLVTVLGQGAIAGGLACYVVSVGIWIVALSRVNVSVAYPMLSIGYVVNALAARALFDEPLGGQRLLGILVIIVGVTLVARS